MSVMQARWAAEYLKQRVAEERVDELKDFRRRIANEIAAETKASRHKDRISGERVHPTQYDVDALIRFVLDRRLRHPKAMEAARRAIKHVDAKALRLLVETVMNHGATDRPVRERCKRVIDYCETIEDALALRTSLQGEMQ